MSEEKNKKKFEERVKEVTKLLNSEKNKAFVAFVIMDDGVHSFMAIPTGIKASRIISLQSCMSRTSYLLWKLLKKSKKKQQSEVAIYEDLGELRGSAA